MKPILLTVIITAVIIGGIYFIYKKNELKNTQEKIMQSEYKQCIVDCHPIIKDYIIGDKVSDEDLYLHRLCIDSCNLNLQEKAKKLILK